MREKTPHCSRIYKKNMLNYFMSDMVILGSTLGLVDIILPG